MAGAPVDAGSYWLEMTLDTGNIKTAAGGAKTKVEIAKKSLTVTAKAQTIIYGGTIENTVSQTECSGLVSGHRLTGISLNAAGADGSQQITPSAAVIVNGSSQTVTGNYDITYQPGTLTVTPRTLTVEAGTAKVSKEYDGTVSAGALTGDLRIAGLLDSDIGNVKVKGVPVNYTSPDVGGQNTTVQLNLTLEGTDVSHYTLKTNTISVPCEIRPKAIELAVSVAGTYAYQGKPVIPTIVVEERGVSQSFIPEKEYTAVFTNNTDAGEAVITITAVKGGNYTWEEVRKTFTIQKTYYTDTTPVEVSAKYGSTVTYDLASILPKGYRLGTVKNITDSDHIFAGAPVLTGTELSCTIIDDTALVGKSASFLVPVEETTNYMPYDLTVKITVSDKQPQSDFKLLSSSADMIYGDADFTLEVSGAATGSTVTYTSSEPAVAAVDQNGKVHILGTGTAAITAQASETDEYLGASAVFSLKVSPKRLAWDTTELSAVDSEKQFKSGQEKNATLFGTLKVSGILSQDVGDVVFDCPVEKLTGVYGAVTPGEQPVTLSWKDDQPVSLQGGKSGNYLLPDALPTLKGRINAVTSSLPDLPESTETTKYKIEVEGGISSVPDTFIKHPELGLDTPDKIEKEMRGKVNKHNNPNQSKDIPESCMEVYDVVLMVDMGAGAGWAEATVNNFPSTGLTITLPYPAGTGQDTHEFVVAHLFTEALNGYEPGGVEYPTVTKTAEGIRFKVFGLSPIAVGWTEIQKAGEPETPESPKDPEDTNKPKDPEDTNKPRDPESTEKPSDQNQNDQTGNNGQNGNGSKPGGGTDAKKEDSAAGSQQTPESAASVTASDNRQQPVRMTQSASTGDHDSVIGYVTLLLLSAALMCFCVKGNKRKGY